MARNGPHIQKYTPAHVAKLTQAISLGSTRTLACKYGGIDLDTLLLWEKKYPEFKAAMLEAEGKGGIGWLGKIELAANSGDWRAAAWKLEHVYPNEYGKTMQDQHQTVLQVSAEELAKLTDAEFDLLYARAHGDRSRTP